MNTVNSRYLELPRDQQIFSRHREFDLSSIRDIEIRQYIRFFKYAFIKLYILLFLVQILTSYIIKTTNVLTIVVNKSYRTFFLSHHKELSQVIPFFYFYS